MEDENKKLKLLEMIAITKCLACKNTISLLYVKSKEIKKRNQNTTWKSVNNEIKNLIWMKKFKGIPKQALQINIQY